MKPRLSISLAVADVDRAVAFYEALGFAIVDGGHHCAEYPDTEQSAWRIMALGDYTIGLFRGMFSGNMLTIHGMDPAAARAAVEAAGFAQADAMVISDPDGNRLLFEKG